MRRGQATVELALSAPFIVGLLALTLQGGIVISDQVNIEHYAYEGAQWQLTHPDAPLNGSGSLQEHIVQQMCNGASAVPATGGTRYCLDQAGQGLPNLRVQVTRISTPAAMRVTDPRPTAQVLAASSCKTWSLSVTPGSASIGASATATFRVTLNVNNDNSSEPVVNLAASGLPPGMANGTAYFNPPIVSTLAGKYGVTSDLRVQTGSNTAPGLQKLLLTGQDQCGRGPTSSLAPVRLTIGGGGGLNPPPLPPLVNVSASVPICSGAVSTVRISGSGFQAGALVKFGAIAAAPGTTVVNSGEIDAVVTLAPGVYDITVTNPDLSTATSLGGLVVLPTAPCPPSNTPTARICASAAGGYQARIEISWSEPLALPLLTTGTPPSVGLDATQLVACQV
ncbi:MAG: pilus assembly protein [Candidatus Dormibacteraeota bacterium]|nr:pilus assembly protein [Candidatus Dormibacteraeota bacterium]